MSHPESERLAWERVGALESEVKRLHSLLGRSVTKLRACAESLRRPESRDSLAHALRSNGVDTYRALEVLSPALRGLAAALDETAAHLVADIDG